MTTKGYRLVLPPGWIQVPVRDAKPGTPHEVVSAAFRNPPAGIPRDSFTSARIELERRLGSMIRKAKTNGGLELFLAYGNAYANPVPASFLIAEGSLGGTPGEDPLAVVTALAEGAARDGGKPGRLTALDGAPAARIEQIGSADAEAGYPSLRVEYTVPVPGADGRWIIITFSTLGDGDPAGQYARLLAELFDAILSTLRWTPAAGSRLRPRPEGRPRTLRAARSPAAGAQRTGKQLRRSRLLHSFRARRDLRDRIAGLPDQPHRALPEIQIEPPARLCHRRTPPP
jgi:hypothetical protein